MLITSERHKTNAAALRWRNLKLVGARSVKRNGSVKSDLSVHAKEGYRSIRRSRLFEPLTRLGFLCKGLVYLLLAVLAIMLAFGAGGATTDQRGAIQFLARRSFGVVALV